jgi:hypothetical protein
MIHVPPQNTFFAKLMIILYDTFSYIYDITLGALKSRHLHFSELLGYLWTDFVQIWTIQNST